MNITLMLFVTLFTLILIELVVRIAFKEKTKQIYAYNEFFETTWHKPNLDLNFETEEYNIAFQTNEIGLRSDQPLKKKGENEVRILNLGDSFIQAAQVDIENTMTEKLQNKLNLISKDTIYNIINLGISSLNAKNQASFLEKNIGKLDEDIIFLFTYIGNDIVTLRDIRKQTENNEQNQTLIVSLLYNMKDYSSLVSLIWERLVVSIEAEWQSEFGRPCQPFDDEPIETSANVFIKENNKYIDNGFNEYFNSIKIIDNLCKKNNIGFCVFFIPTKEQIDNEKLNEVIDFFDLEMDHLDMSKPQRLISHYLSSNEILYIDLTDTLRSASTLQATYFDFDSHWNIYGNEIVAEYISNQKTLLN